jgi:hypothetical protein
MERRNRRSDFSLLPEFRGCDQVEQIHWNELTKTKKTLFRSPPPWMTALKLTSSPPPPPPSLSNNTRVVHCTFLAIYTQVVLYNVLPVSAQRGSQLIYVLLSNGSLHNM